MASEEQLMAPDEVAEIADAVAHLDAGAADARLAVPGEAFLAPKKAGELQELKEQEFMACSEEWPSERFAEDAVGILDDWPPVLAALDLEPDYGLRAYLAAIGCPPAELLSAEDLSAITEKLCGRPLWATPVYFAEEVASASLQAVAARLLIGGHYG